ncbi:accessory Sec system protein translocase subunit SecY2 [Oenococcus alcoholitolerans]|uniref:accessory Sec system protein translocase subunit SecY2 n=1 Tax=Oenococcus alcoholitolerans TaxID=931074 RepID=UPI003F705546
MILLVILFVYQIGQMILIPGISNHLFTNALTHEYSLNFAASITGGNLQQFSLFALGLGPYMTAMIVWSSVSSIKSLGLNRISQKKSYFIKMVITLLIAFMQAYVISRGLSFSADSNFLGPDRQTKVLLVSLILIIGSMIAAWLSEYNQSFGIGGPGAVIIAGIVGNWLIVGRNYLYRDLFYNFNFNSLTGVVVLALGALILVTMIVAVYQAEYRVRIQHIMINDDLSKNAYLPIKLMPSGAMPFMFSISLFALLRYLILFFSSLMPNLGWLRSFGQRVSLDQPQGAVLYLFSLALLSFAFAFLTVNPTQIAKDLQKSGDYVIDIRPGQRTKKYIRSLVNKMTFFGFLFLSLISGVPLLLGNIDRSFYQYFLFIGIIVTLIGMSFTVIEQVRALLQKYNYQDIFSEADFSKKEGA